MMYLSRFNTSLKSDGSLVLTVKDSSGVTTARIKSWKKGFFLQIEFGRESSLNILDHERTLLNKAHNKDMDLPIHIFIKNIPKKYKKVVMGQRAQQYSLLYLFRYIPASYDFHLSNQLLLSLIIFRKISLVETANLINLQQHKILEFLYPNNKSCFGYKSIVRIIKSRIITCGIQKELKLIDEFLTKLISGVFPCYNQKNLLHIKYIPAFVLDPEYIDFAFILHPNLFFEPIRKAIDCAGIDINGKEFELKKERLLNVISAAQDTYYMAQGIGVDSHKLVHRFYHANNMNALSVIHNEIMVKSRAFMRNSHPRKLTMPDISHIEPPIPGSSYIRPLRKYLDFINESKEMNHCLDTAGYIFSVRDGLSFIYAVKTDNDRCTLELGISENKQLFIKQLLAYHNAPPKKETLRVVNSWLRKS